MKREISMSSKEKNKISIPRVPFIWKILEHLSQPLAITNEFKKKTSYYTITHSSVSRYGP